MIKFKSLEFLSLSLGISGGGQMLFTFLIFLTGSEKLKFGKWVKYASEADGVIHSIEPTIYR